MSQLLRPDQAKVSSPLGRALIFAASAPITVCHSAGLASRGPLVGRPPAVRGRTARLFSLDSLELVARGCVHFACAM